MLELHKQLKLGDFLADTHVHLNSERFNDDLDSVISAALDEKVEEIFDVSVDILSSERSVKISNANEKVKSFVGIDPEVFIPGSDMFLGLDIEEKWFEESFTKLDQIIKNNKENIVGIGETGMDFYWMSKDSKIDIADKELSKKLQQKLYRMHLELAQKYELPLTIHSRGAEQQCLDILDDYNVTGIFHSYTGNLKTAKRILDSRCGLGVNGIVTFKNATELQQLYKSLIGDTKIESPIDLYQKGIFLETDGPYLAPHPHRGERNEPKYIVNIFEKILEIARS